MFRWRRRKGGREAVFCTPRLCDGGGSGRKRASSRGRGRWGEHNWFVSSPQEPRCSCSRSDFVQGRHGGGVSAFASAVKRKADPLNTFRDPLNPVALSGPPCGQRNNFMLGEESGGIYSRCGWGVVEWFGRRVSFFVAGGELVFPSPQVLLFTIRLCLWKTWPMRRGFCVRFGGFKSTTLS